MARSYKDKQSEPRAFLPPTTNNFFLKESSFIAKHDNRCIRWNCLVSKTRNYNGELVFILGFTGSPGQPDELARLRDLWGRPLNLGNLLAPRTLQRLSSIVYWRPILEGLCSHTEVPCTGVNRLYPQMMQPCLLFRVSIALVFQDSGSLLRWSADVVLQSSRRLLCNSLVTQLLVSSNPDSQVVIFISTYPKVVSQ